MYVDGEKLARNGHKTAIYESQIWCTTLYYVSYLFPVLFKLQHFWGLKIENQILFSTGQYPYKDHATFSSVLSTTIFGVQDADAL